MCGLLLAGVGGDLRMRYRGRVSLLVTLLILLPLFPAPYGQEEGLAPIVSSASNCGSEEQPEPMDPERVEFFNMINQGGFGGEDEAWLEARDYGGIPVTDSDLESLTSSFYTSSILINDTAIGLRMNLTTGWKYTICVNLQALNDSEIRPSTDIYLIQETQFGRYDFDYDSRHNSWDGMRDEIAHSSPWLQNLILWNSFRDVHSYEKVEQVAFSVALDHEERSFSLFGGESEPRTMFLMIDAWDNIRDYDAKPQNINYSADITVLVEERFSLPNWTVSLTCCGGLIGLLAAPFILHRRFMKAGLDENVSSGGGDLMPHLETGAERPNEYQPLSGEPPTN